MITPLYHSLLYLIRSILEYAVPAWFPMTTVENITDIERVQRCAHSITFGNKSYKKLFTMVQGLTRNILINFEYRGFGLKN